MLSTIQNGSSVSNQQFVGIDLIGSLFSDFENQEVFESSGDVEALDSLLIPTFEGSWHLGPSDHVVLAKLDGGLSSKKIETIRKKEESIKPIMSYHDLSWPLGCDCK